MEDVNDNPPTFPSTNVRISVPESHPLRTALYIAHATDPDRTPSAPVRYQLGQNSNDLFGIDTHTGELYLSRRLDYETQQRHNLMISAVDGAGLSANITLSVEVQDVNDNPPVFERNEYHVEIPEGAKLDSQVRKIFITRPSYSFIHTYIFIYIYILLYHLFIAYTPAFIYKTSLYNRRGNLLSLSLSLSLYILRTNKNKPAHIFIYIYYTY